MEKVVKMFKLITKVCIKNKWFKLLKEALDTCVIELDALNKVNFYIVSPIEIRIKPYSFGINGEYAKNKVSQAPLTSSDLAPDENEMTFSEFHKKYYLKIVKHFPDELIQHKIIQTYLNYQWKYISRINSFELFIYFLFLVFFSLSSCRLFKQQRYPEWFEWFTFAIICLNMIFIIKNIIFSKWYYFYSFAHLFELINMALCITAIGLPIHYSINQKTSFWSFSIAYAYINLVFRFEATQLFGSVSYAFRKIMLKSIRVVPIVISLCLGFSFAFNVRSRFITEPGEEYDEYEMHPFGKFVSTNIINISLMFMGNIEIEEMGLGKNGSTGSTFINYLLTDAFIFIMCLFLFNLFIGIAVGEVNDMVKKGETHLLKVRFDMMHQNQSLFSFLGLNFKFLHKQFIWEYNKKKTERSFFEIYTVLFYKLFNWKYSLYSKKVTDGIDLEDSSINSKNTVEESEKQKIKNNNNNFNQNSQKLTIEDV